MRKTIGRRWLCLVLALVLLAGCLPVSAAFGAESERAAAASRAITEADEALLRQDVFARIDAVVEAAAERTGGAAALTVGDYCAMLPQVRQAVEASQTYAPGTLRQNGSYLTWETLEGFACCFDPRMEAVVRGSASTGTETEAFEAPESAFSPALPGGAEPNGGSPVSPTVGMIAPFGLSPETGLQTNFAEYGQDFVQKVTELSQATGGSAVFCHTGSATIDNTARILESCGFVMIHSHGVTDYYDPDNDDETSQANCSYLCLTNYQGVTLADMDRAIGPYGRYYYAVIGCGYAEVSGTAIANHMQKNAPHSMLYLAICSGMATDGLFAPLRAKGVEAVWGYSQPVWFIGDRIYMLSLLEGICQGRTLAQAAADTKRANGYWDPAFPDYTLAEAIADHAAFPIVVSSEDAYPGHDGVNAIQTVRSTWRLVASAYPVEAQPDDPAHGSVTVRGRYVFAEPTPGYQTAGCQLLSGSATVQRDGDLFVVTPGSACVLEVLFAQKETVTLTCQAGGETVCTLETLEGETVTLPETAPAVEDWTFLGWTESPAPLAADRPAALEPGADCLVSEDCTFYALYGRLIPCEEPVYRLVTEAPASWTGEYVITSNDQLCGRCVLSGISGNNASYLERWAEGCPYFSDSGIEMDGDLLRHVGDRFRFAVAETDGGYTIRSVLCDNYLSDRLGSFMTSTNSAMYYCAWELGFSSRKPFIHSLVNTRYTYLCYDRSEGFFLYDRSLNNIELWKAEAGIQWLCTADPEAHVHSPGVSEEENRVEPDCTEPGGCDLVVRCAVCYAVVESTHVEIPALGHDVEESVTPPTCTAGGFTTAVCRRCGYAETRDETEPLGHDWEAPTYTWAEDLSAVTASRSCRRDGTHRETETAQTEAEVVKEATFEEEGELRYTAVFENPAFTPQTRTVTTPRLERVNPFADVGEDKYYCEPVLWAYYHAPQITAGTGETTFGPNETCTRAQIVTFLWKAADCPEPETEENPFSDVKPGKYYYKAVLWAAEQGITSGTGEGTFGPNEGCTRAQVVTFLWHYAGSPEPNGTENPFEDVRDGKYYRQAILWAYYHEPQITAGTGETTFGPNTICTRGQIVTFLYKYLH